MPTAPFVACRHPGCSALVVHGYCLTHDRQLQQSRRDRGKRWYFLARWKAYRRQQLDRDPLCAWCRSRGRVTEAVDVDHVRPHGNDPALFWDVTNLQSLCRSCHTRKSQRER